MNIDLKKILLKEKFCFKLNCLHSHFRKSKRTGRWWLKSRLLEFFHVGRVSMETRQELKEWTLKSSSWSSHSCAKGSLANKSLHNIPKLQSDNIQNHHSCGWNVWGGGWWNEDHVTFKIYWWIKKGRCIIFLKPYSWAKEKMQSDRIGSNRCAYHWKGSTFFKTFI